jgi:ATP-dependent Lon protease
LAPGCGEENTTREALDHVRTTVLVTPRRAGDADPVPDRIYRVGVLAQVKQGLRLDDGSIKALFEFTTRGRIEYYTGNTEYLEAQVAPFVETAGSRDAIATLARSAVLQFTTYVKLHPKIPATTATSVGRIEDPSELADIIASHLAIDVPNEQEILESASVSDRLQRVLSSMSGALFPLQSVENDRDSKADATRVGTRLPTLKFARYAGR